MAPNVDRIIERNTKLKGMKQPWLPLYQALAMYVFLRKQYFTIDHLKAPFMLNLVYDSTAIHAAHMMAASLVGQIMPNPFESFEFVPQVAQQGDMDDDEYQFFMTVNEVMPAVLSLPDVGMMTSLLECILDMGVFGIGSLCVDETGDYAVPLRMYSADAKVMSVDEDQNGKVDTVYLEKMMRVGQVVEKYGYDNCSDQVKKMYDGQQLDAEIKVLQAIEPRRERNPLKLGNLDMKWSSVHVELVDKAGEMGLDPPKMSSSEDVLGAGKIPWGPGVDIPIHTSGRLGTDRRAPIEIIQTVQNPSWATDRIADLRANIQEYFM